MGLPSGNRWRTLDREGWVTWLKAGAFEHNHADLNIPDLFYSGLTQNCSLAPYGRRSYGHEALSYHPICVSPITSRRPTRHLTEYHKRLQETTGLESSKEFLSKFPFISGTNQIRGIKEAAHKQAGRNQKERLFDQFHKCSRLSETTPIKRACDPSTLPGCAPPYP